MGSADVDAGEGDRPADRVLTAAFALAVGGAVAAVGTAFLVAGVNDVWVAVDGQRYVSTTLAYYLEAIALLAVGWAGIVGGVRFAVAY